MFHIRVRASELAIGDTLANGNTVTIHEDYPNCCETVWGESDGTIHVSDRHAPVTLAGTTNCIYGGYAIGHSSGFCTADACY